MPKTSFLRRKLYLVVDHPEIYLGVNDLILGPKQAYNIDLSRMTNGAQSEHKGAYCTSVN